VSSDRSLEPAGSTEPGLAVRLRFKLADERAARQLAARVIDRAHELANLPECECDLDVEVQWTPVPGAPAPSAAQALDPAPDPPPER